MKFNKTTIITIIALALASYSSTQSHHLNQIITFQAIGNSRVQPLHEDAFNLMIEEFRQDSNAFVEFHKKSNQSPLYFLDECDSCVFSRKEYPDNRTITEKAILAYAQEHMHDQETITFTSLGSFQLLQELVIMTQLVLELADHGTHYMRLNLIDLQYTEYFKNYDPRHPFHTIFCAFMQWVYMLSSMSGVPIDVYAYSSAQEYLTECSEQPAKTDILTLIDINPITCKGESGFNTCLTDFCTLLTQACNPHSFAAAAISYNYDIGDSCLKIIRYDFFYDCNTTEWSMCASKHRKILKHENSTAVWQSDAENISLSPAFTENLKPTFNDLCSHVKVHGCAICQETENLQHCANCTCAFYCSREHQKEDWPDHTSICKHLQTNYKQPGKTTLTYQTEVTYSYIRNGVSISRAYPNSAKVIDKANALQLNAKFKN